MYPGVPGWALGEEASGGSVSNDGSVCWPMNVFGTLLVW